MIGNADPVAEIAEIYDDRLAQIHCPADMLTHIRQTFAIQAEMASRLAAAKRGAARQKLERRPHPEPIDRMTPRLDFIDAKPEARSRQPAHVGHGLLDQSLQLMPRSSRRHRYIGLTPETR
jgi:hypothetical protein